MPVSAPAGDKKVLRASVLHYDPEPSSNDVQDAAEPFPEGTARVVMFSEFLLGWSTPSLIRLNAKCVCFSSTRARRCLASTSLRHQAQVG